MKKDARRRLQSYMIAGFFVVLGVLLDQWTKFLAVAKLKDQEPVVLIDRVFQLCYLENKGAAFGMFQNRISFFLLTTIVILIAAIYLYGVLPARRRYLPLRMCIAAVIAGAIGNMIDRIRLGYVVDFFYFNLIDFPIFNVADIYVTVSIFILLILMFFYYKEEDFEQIFQRRK